MYEEAQRGVLTPRMPFIVRVDGRAFHTYTHGLSLHDPIMEDGMTRVGQALVDSVPNSKLVYIQSDEASLLVTPYDSLLSEPWFGGVIQKIASVSASIATAAFGQPREKRVATFDARVFTIPREEVANYFVWRQQDATRNSILSLAQSKFSHRELQGKNRSEMQEMLFQRFGLNWNDLRTHHKRGWVVDRHGVEMQMPILTQDREFIEQYLYLDEVEV